MDFFSAFNPNLFIVGHPVFYQVDLPSCMKPRTWAVGKTTPSRWDSGVSYPLSKFGKLTHRCSRRIKLFCRLITIQFSFSHPNSFFDSKGHGRVTDIIKFQIFFVCIFFFFYNILGCFHIECGDFFICRANAQVLSVGVHPKSENSSHWIVNEMNF